MPTIDGSHHDSWAQRQKLQALVDGTLRSFGYRIGHTSIFGITIVKMWPLSFLWDRIFGYIYLQSPDKVVIHPSNNRDLAIAQVMGQHMEKDGLKVTIHVPL